MTTRPPTARHDAVAHVGEFLAALQRTDQFWKPIATVDGVTLDACFLRALADAAADGDLHELGLRTEVNNALRANGIRTIEQLAARTFLQLRGIRTLGRGRVAAIEAALNERGLTLTEVDR